MLSETFRISETTGTGFNEALSDGLYSARIVGIVSEESEFQGKVSEKMAFILQVRNDENKIIYKKSKRFTFSLMEKSNFAKMMSKVLQCANDSTVLKNAMIKAGLMNDRGDISLTALVNLPVTAYMTGTPSKKDPSKTYYNIESLAPVTAKNPELPLDTTYAIPTFLKNVWQGKHIDSLINDKLNWADDNVNLSNVNVEDGLDNIF